MDFLLLLIFIMYPIRGVVINGLFHNDDPEAENEWMPAGSFWTQPKGQVHITSAKGENLLAYIEIEEGPYLVKPTEEAFHTDEVPLNMDQSNIVWLNAADIRWISKSVAGSQTQAKVAMLWGDKNEQQFYGSMLKLPAGFAGKLVSHAGSFKAVVIKGDLQYQFPKLEQAVKLTPGSYFASSDNGDHQLSVGERELVLYIRTNGEFELK
ncbi:hypothetical protein PEDI_11070 [Persicobacter diffluens]|uniref:DUF4437 domain-containing protein n=2 Tax=Persicobacter diffluens TaxID=981 RepID=A0AAN4VXG5_9BACT|nr:hypothetical protein PEDI_11070 [Persicobacter diffluens]